MGVSLKEGYYYEVLTKDDKSYLGVYNSKDNNFMYFDLDNNNRISYLDLSDIVGSIIVHSELM